MPVTDSLPLEQLEIEIIACHKCPRLVAWREQVGRVKRRAFREEAYWARPVPGFGDPEASVLVVGLAPGAHGSNRTDRTARGVCSWETIRVNFFIQRCGGRVLPINQMEK